MSKISDIGRIFYGLAIAGMGIPTVYDHDFPYMLMPLSNSPGPGQTVLTYITGVILILIGVSIVSKIKIGLVSFLFGSVLFLIFCFYYIPYQFIYNPNYRQLVEWDNAGKELALAGGAFIIAQKFSEKNGILPNRFFNKIPFLGTALFAIPIITFGILHFMVAKDVATLIPTWIPGKLFWAYFAGAALLSSGIAILFKFRYRQAAFLLGTMIFIWFVILHMPRVIAAPATDLEGEVTSAFLALAYSGIAFVIAGVENKTADDPIKRLRIE